MSKGVWGFGGGGGTSTRGGCVPEGRGRGGGWGPGGRGQAGGGGGRERRVGWAGGFVLVGGERLAVTGWDVKGWGGFWGRWVATGSGYTRSSPAGGGGPPVGWWRGTGGLRRARLNGPHISGNGAVAHYLIGDRKSTRLNSSH